MRSFINTSKISILVGIALLGLTPTGCAESDLENTSEQRPADAGHQDAGHQDADPADTTPDTDTIDYTPCVLAGAEPWGNCVDPTTLDFGQVGEGQSVTHLLRIDNIGEVELLLNEARLEDPNFEVQARRYTPGSNPAPTNTTLPADLASGASFFFEITAENPGTAGDFSTDVFEILLKPDTSTEIETLSIPLAGDFEVCEAPFSNCDGDPSNGCETDTDSSLEHCGGCNIACDLPGASATCSAGVCEFLKCDDDSVDLNGDPSDGCECQITDANDLPDAAGLDSNCDGIDGDAARAIYVATGGSDTAAGTRAAPLRTITAAIAQASSASGLDHIYVATGQYAEQVTLSDGISIFGGYDADNDWTRSDGATSEVFYDGPGERIAVRGVGITSETYLGRMEVVTADTSVASQSNYAMHCKGCGGLVLQNSTLSAGHAGPGASGVNGESGATAFGSGSNGGVGGDGDGDGPSWGAGGTGGASGCGRTGGDGGRGGLRGNNDGLRGGNGISGSAGGSGGAGDDSFFFPKGEPGSIGARGATVSDGQGGSGGAGGQVIGDLWSGNAGSDGADGPHGNGGGGGGGGGGQEAIDSALNGSGNGGGGGGGGGCGGLKGTGGGAGGSSFGLFLVDSNGITLTNNTITAGNGGNGGRGGNGGAGSAGGAGVAGGQAATSEVGAGGTGGDGSKGGDGGHGGGGAGGNSYGVYRQNTTLDLPGSNTITKGNPGNGGPSAGNSGADGVAENF